MESEQEDRRHSTRLLQIDSGAETGLVNSVWRFRDRMLLMIGNFSALRERASFSCLRASVSYRFFSRINIYLYYLTDKNVYNKNVIRYKNKIREVELEIR